MRQRNVLLEFLGLVLVIIFIVVGIDYYNARQDGDTSQPITIRVESQPETAVFSDAVQSAPPRLLAPVIPKIGISDGIKRPVFTDEIKAEMRELHTSGVGRGGT